MILPSVLLAMLGGAPSLPPARALFAGVDVRVDVRPCSDAVFLERDADGRIRACYDPDDPRGRERATVAALALAFDDRHHLSADPAWRAINGWYRTADGWHARNQDFRGYAHPLGRQSPAHDLATVLARLLVPTAADALFPDRSPACTMMSQARFVRRMLRSYAPGAAWEPAPTCPAFERWAQPHDLVRVELMMAAPSAASAGSLFGHVFLGLVHADAAGNETTTTVSYFAVTGGPGATDPLYPLKGITGYFRARLQSRPLVDTLQDYGLVESRTIQRWRLDLTPRQQRVLLERIWTVMHTSCVRYTFFRSNCAALVVDLVNSLDADVPEIRFRHSVASGPAQIVEGFDRSGILGALGEPYPGREQEAARARMNLREALTRLVPRPPSALRRRLFDSSADVRSRAYAELAHFGDPAHVARALHWAAIVEADANAVANLERTQALEAARLAHLSGERDHLLARLEAVGLGAVTGPLVSTGRDARMRGYLAVARGIREGRWPLEQTDLLRRFVLVQSEIKQDVAAMKRAREARRTILFPDRAPLFDHAWASDLRPWIGLRRSTRVSPALHAVAAAKARVRQRGRPEPIPLRRPTRGAIPATGTQEVGALFGERDGSAVGVVHLGILRQELGDQRRYGFSADTSLVVLDGEVELSADSIVPERSRLTLIRYRRLHTVLPARRALVPGWDVGVDHVLGPDDNALWLSTSGLVSLLNDRSLQSHCLLRGRAYLGADIEGRALSVDGELALESRVPLYPGAASGNTLDTVFFARAPLSQPRGLRRGVDVRLTHRLPRRVSVGPWVFYLRLVLNAQVEWAPDIAPQRRVAFGVVLD